MFVFGIVKVTNASLPMRCAWIMATAEGMRTIGASGGPFFPHETKTTKEPHTMTREGHDDGRRTLEITNMQSLLRDLVPFVMAECHSAAIACSEALG